MPKDLKRLCGTWVNPVAQGAKVSSTLNDDLSLWDVRSWKSVQIFFFTALFPWDKPNDKLLVWLERITFHLSEVGSGSRAEPTSTAHRRGVDTAVELLNHGNTSSGC